MGFIENLRRQRELKAKEMEDAQKFARAREEQQRALLLRDEKQTKRLEMEKAKQIKIDLELAEMHFSRSEFARLAKELASTLGNTVLIKGVISASWSVGFIYEYRDHEYPPDNNIHELSQKDKEYHLDQRNPLSQVGVSLIWHRGEEYHHIEKNNPFRGDEVWDELYNFITIGCDPLGKITLRKSRGNIELPMSKWLGNPTIQEEALGKAYNNPAICRNRRSTPWVSGDYSSPYHEPSPEHPQQ